jgi:hypothetical protein
LQSSCKFKLALKPILYQHIIRDVMTLYIQMQLDLYYLFQVEQVKWSLKAGTDAGTPELHQLALAHG